MSDIITAEVDSLEGVPEALHGLFVEEEGKFRAKVAPAAKVSEFRNTNINLAKKAEQLERELEGARKGSAKAQELEGELAKAREELEVRKLGHAPDEIEELLQTRVQSMVASHKNEREAMTKQVEELTSSVGELTNRYNRRVLESEVMMTLGELSDKIVPGTAKEFIRDLLADGWQVDGDRLVLKDEQGGIIPGPDPNSPKTIKDAILETKRSAPWRWKAGVSGGGATGNNGATGSKEISRSDFERLDQSGRKAFIRGGGKVVD